MISVCAWSLGTICSTFSSKVIRESRSPTRSSIARFGLRYFGVASDAAFFSCPIADPNSNKQATQANATAPRGSVLIGEFSYLTVGVGITIGVRKYRPCGSVFVRELFRLFGY